MKKSLLFCMVILWAGFLCVGCVDKLVPVTERQEPQPVADNLVTIKATLGNEDTKTAMNNNMELVWSEGDAIRIFRGMNSEVFTLTQA